MSSFNRKINRNKSQQKVNNIKYSNVSKSVDKETFEYGLNYISKIISPTFEGILESNLHLIKGSNDLHKLCNFVKNTIQEKGFFSFEYKGFDYGVQLKEFYIDNIDSNMNVKFYIEVDVGISEESYNKKHN